MSVLLKTNSGLLVYISAPRSGLRLVDFSVAECVKHFDCGGKAVFSLDFIESGGPFVSKSGKINKPLVPAGR
jgi:hypothetical protein